MLDRSEEDEQELVKRAVADLSAFQALYQRYIRRIYGYVVSRVGNPHDAEDVVSEVFLRVIKNLPQLRNQQAISFAVWIFMIARSTVTDHYRRNGHSNSLISLDMVEPLIAVEPDPDWALIKIEDTAQLHEMIVTLPERKREIITLRYYGGLRNQEIAVVLQIGEKTVSAYLSRALSDLHEKYMALQSRDEQRSFNDER